jgi:ribA/ribD-fused uncharacterized protein
MSQVTDARMPVAGFFGPYRFLSNFYERQVTWGGWAWPTSEHAYQAAKNMSQEHWERVLLASTPGIAKRVGRQAVLRPGWDQMKKKIMFDIVWTKFTQHPGLAEMLVRTGWAELTELNTWGDTYWGVVEGRGGTNYLGRILMCVRDLLRED